MANSALGWVAAPDYTVLPRSLTSFCSVFSDHTALLLSARRFCWTKSETSDEIEFVLITKSRYKWNLVAVTTVRAAGTRNLKMPGSEDDEGVGCWYPHQCSRAKALTNKFHAIHPFQPQLIMTFYQIAFAVLSAKVTLQHFKWGIKWSNVRRVRLIKTGDENRTALQVLRSLSLFLSLFFFFIMQLWLGEEHPSYLW